MSPFKPLRVWPGAVFGALAGLLFFVLPAVSSDAAMIGLAGGLASALAVLVWWLFFSRAPWPERLGVIAFVVLAVAVTYRLVDESISGGAMGFMLTFFSLPAMAAALGAAVFVTRHAPTSTRRASLVIGVAMACGFFTMLRTDGMWNGNPQLHWRWTPTAEDLLLAKAENALPAAPVAAPATAASDPAAPVAAPAAVAPSTPVETAMPAEWPGFRGPSRDGVVRNLRIGTDWAQSPPVVVWKRDIGPGWSSFAVQGDLLYTQEQRGNDEVVAAYSVATGKPMWAHKDPVRFYESNGGAGPRGTPTLSGGRVYTFGATGILNALDARTGAVLWSGNVARDTDTKVPGWGFSSSPLVAEGVVIVAAAGNLAGYDAATGKHRWTGPRHGGSYSSPQLVTIDGVAQVVMMSSAGTTSVAPATGDVLWEHAWEGGAIVQPAVLPDGGLLINTIAATGGLGVRRLNVAHASG
ncbi:MAG TPA: PQQ-binding-like beta-propeller repeat protein, partial [Vicinamibacterales bacterium]|nr:PQQ-binding-like beta-propeller repeat protein [Vicinamibacterales bacterium]